MSKLGKMPIPLPKGVKVTVTNNTVLAEGPKGKITRQLPAGIKLEVVQDKVKLSRGSEDKQTKASHGLARAVLNGMVKGVSEGFTKTLVAVGVGYRMSVQGTKLTVSGSLWKILRKS